MSGILHVGVTGTRHVLPDPQRAALARVLGRLNVTPGITSVIGHHGLCSGTDAFAHQIMRGLGWRIEGHPGHGRDGRSPWQAMWLLDDLDVLHPSRRYYVRDRAIARACSVLPAAPAYPEDDPRSAHSGTWLTVRVARAWHRRIIYAWPDGSVTETESRRAEDVTA